MTRVGRGVVDVGMIAGAAVGVGVCAIPLHIPDRLDLHQTRPQLIRQTMVLFKGKSVLHHLTPDAYLVVVQVDNDDALQRVGRNVLQLVRVDAQNEGHGRVHDVQQLVGEDGNVDMVPAEWEEKGKERVRDRGEEGVVLAMEQNPLLRENVGEEADDA